MRWYAVLAIGLLSACASAGGWTKEGASDAQIRADLAECRTFAGDLTERDRVIDRDIAAARSGSRIDETNLLRDDVRDFGEAQRYDLLVGQCMQGRGYARGKAPAET